MYIKEKLFNPKKLSKLNNSQRLKALPPQFIIDKSGIKNPKVVIDLGAGTGFYSIPFAREYKYCKIYACDISEVMVDWMLDHVSDQYENIIPVKIEDNSILLIDEIADFLFMINLHHELDKPKETLEECYRLIKVGGKITISDFKKEKSEVGPPYEQRVEPSEVMKMLLETGFSDIRIYNELEQNYLITATKA